MIGESMITQFIQLVPEYVSGQDMLGYFPVHPKQINLTRLRIWPEYCLEHHEGSCHSLPHWQITPLACSLILIDVMDHCLVHFPDQTIHRYIALSYVWGQTRRHSSAKQRKLQ